MSTPEWDIFDRLDEVEEIALKLMEKADTTEPTLKDTSTVARDGSILAKYAIFLSFVAASRKGFQTQKNEGRDSSAFEDRRFKQRNIGLSRRIAGASL